MKLLKYPILLLILVMVSSFSVPKKYDFNEHKIDKNVKWMSFEEAVKASKTAKSNGEIPKKIFIDVYTDWCGWCKKMDKNTFENPKISKYLNENFYPVKLNAEQKENIEFAGRTFKFVDNGRRGYHELAVSLMNGKMSYPTVIFMDEDLQVLQRIPGYLDVNRLNMIVRYLGEDIFENTPWPEYQQQYKAEN